MSDLPNQAALLSIVVPAYRQAETIRADIVHIQGVIDALAVNYELIVVADGQLDQTHVQANKESSAKVFVFGYPGRNRGKGYALRFGVARARGQKIVFLDAGMDIDPAGIAMLLAHMDWYDADVVVGSKRHPVSKVEYPPVRRILSIGYQILVRLLFGLRIRDTQTGLKVFRREVLARVLPRLLVKDYAIDIEILSVAHHLGFKRIYEAPVNVNHPFGSLTQRSVVVTILRMLKDTLAVFYRLKIQHYYDDNHQRHWIYDPELEMKVNVG